MGLDGLIQSGVSWVMMLPFRLIVFAWIASLGSEVFSQAILPSRTWTHSNGKAVEAELLKFTSELNEKGLVRLRLRTGATVPVSPPSLSREDLAIILKAWFDKEFRERYNSRLEAYFFYSEEVPDRKVNQSSVAYIGCDEESSWMRLRLGAPSSIVQKGSAIILVNNRNLMVRLPYTDEDVDYSGAGSIVDLSLTKNRSKLAAIWASPEKGRIYIEDGSGDYQEVSLSKAEKTGFREVTLAFDWLFRASKDYVWWSTFTGKKVTPKPASPAKVESEAPEPAMIAKQSWVLETTGETFEAEVKGFDRHRVNFVMEDGKKRLISVDDLSLESRQVIAKARLNTAFEESWHPYENETIWYWQRAERDLMKRLGSNQILFSKQKESGAPQLILQARFMNTSGQSIASCRIKSSSVSMDLEFLSEEGRSIELRSPQFTTIWFTLNQDEADLLKVASPGLETIDFEIKSSDGESVTETLKKVEFQNTVEAIEVFRVSKSIEEG